MNALVFKILELRTQHPNLPFTSKIIIVETSCRDVSCLVLEVQRTLPLKHPFNQGNFFGFLLFGAPFNYVQNARSFTFNYLTINNHVLYYLNQL